MAFRAVSGVLAGSEFRNRSHHPFKTIPGEAVQRPGRAGVSPSNIDIDPEDSHV